MDNENGTGTVVEEKKLEFQEGSSDKVYNLRLIKGDDGFTVSAEYGRRGAKLSTDLKTKTPVGEEEARKVFTKTLGEKTRKGYREAAAA